MLMMDPLHRWRALPQQWRCGVEDVTISISPPRIPRESCNRNNKASKIALIQWIDRYWVDRLEFNIHGRHYIQEDQRPWGNRKIGSPWWSWSTLEWRTWIYKLQKWLSTPARESGKFRWSILHENVSWLCLLGAMEMGMDWGLENDTWSVEWENKIGIECKKYASKLFDLIFLHCRCRHTKILLSSPSWRRDRLRIGQSRMAIAASITHSTRMLNRKCASTMDILDNITAK